jgi:interferon gamma-inducible protein 30
LKKYDLYTQALPFIICLESGSNDWIASGKRCSSTHGLDWNQIYQCSTSAEGVQAQVEIAQVTESLVPAHTYVPWIVANGQHTTSAENAISQSMVRYVCSVYKGSEKIAACG